MAKIKYSYGELTDQFTVIVADNDPVHARVKLTDDSMNIVVVFIPTPNPEAEDIKLAWRSENDVVHFTFYGWKNSLGTTTSQVNTIIGNTNANRPVYITVSHHMVGTANQLTMQFIVGHLLGD